MPYLTTPPQPDIATVPAASPPLLTRPFLLMCLASCLFFTAYHLITPAFPIYCQSLHLSGTLTGLLVGVFMLASLVARPFIGRRCDQSSKLPVMATGALLFLLTSLLYPVWPHPAFLLVLRLVQGVGFAMFYTGSSSFMTEIIPPVRRVEGISYHSNAVKLAIAFAPLAGLALVAQGWFVAVFAASAGMGLIAWWAIRRIAAQAPPFVAPAAALPAKLFNRKVVFPGVMIAVNSLVFGALIPFAPLMAQAKHLESAQWFYLVYALSLIATRFLTAKTADRHGRAFVIVPGMLLVAASLWLLAASTDMSSFLLAASLYGLGAGVVQPALIGMAVDRSLPHERGSAMATFTMFTDGGHAVGSLLMGWMSDVASLDAGLLCVSAVVIAGWVFFVLKERLLSRWAPSGRAFSG